MITPRKQYGGNPVSIAVASAVLDVIERDNLKDHALEVGKALLDGLQELKHKYSVIGDVRGRGLFIGIDLVKSRLTKDPSSDIADYVVKKLKEEHIIMSTEGKYGNVLKIKPPMSFSVNNANHVLSKLDMILSKVNKYLSSRSTSGTSSIGSWDEEEDEQEQSSDSDSFTVSNSIASSFLE